MSIPNRVAPHNMPKGRDHRSNSSAGSNRDRERNTSLISDGMTLPTQVPLDTVDGLAYIQPSVPG